MLSQAGQGTSICVTGDAFDAKLELLNLQNGTVNLDTGEFYQARREDMLTQIANVAYDTNALCPRWERFVSEALESDLETVRYLQRVTGYLLTGSQREQCFLMSDKTSLDTAPSYDGLVENYRGVLEGIAQSWLMRGASAFARRHRRDRAGAQRQGRFGARHPLPCA